MTTEIVEGLGSMSAMLLIISLIVIGAVMAVKNKIVNKRLRRSQVAETEKVSENAKSEPDQQPTESTQDVDKLLDNLKKDVED